MTETVTFKGPVHNEIAAPGPRDNNTLWLERFDRAFYEKLILSEEGVTERARMDLIDPLDGKPGIDLRGLTMANFYKEVSAGKVEMPLADMFWGDYFGSLEDRFGTRWMFNCGEKA